MSSFKPTYLYIKQHNKTGLKYFGKTAVSDPIKYKGSGKYWKLHIKKHGEDVSTIWYKLFENMQELIEYAITFSKENNIVESTEWANLKIEDGADGGGLGNGGKNKGKKMPLQTAEHRAKNAAAQIGNTRAKALKGRKQDRQHVLNRSAAMVGKNTGPQNPDHIAKRFPKKVCQYCEISFTPTNFKRWHGDNCKRKNND